MEELQKLENELEYYNRIFTKFSEYDIKFQKLFVKFPESTNIIIEFFRLFNELYKKIKELTIINDLLRKCANRILRYRYVYYYKYNNDKTIRLAIDLPIKYIETIEKILKKYNINLIHKINNSSNFKVDAYTFKGIFYEIYIKSLNNLHKLYDVKYYDRMIEESANIFYKNYCEFNFEKLIIMIETDLLSRRSENQIGEIIQKVNQIYGNIILFMYDNGIICILNPNAKNILAHNNNINFYYICYNDRYNIIQRIVEWFVNNGYCDSIDSYNGNTRILTIDHVPDQPKGANE